MSRLLRDSNTKFIVIDAQDNTLRVPISFIVLFMYTKSV